MASGKPDGQTVMNKVLLLSPEKCIGCRTCEIVCSFSKIRAFNPRISRVSVFSFEEMAISVPMMCMQCEEPYCMKVCPTSAITRTEEGVVAFDEKKCIGCKLCISACPLGNISFSHVEGKIAKCDLCGGEPKCAEFCPSGAIEFKEPVPSAIERKKAIAEKFKELFGEGNE
ncbi:Anaerobic dimethyl sulfoxide reductase chain B [Fervidicola ferrireducens]|uniref:Anaerobic dimethyl sulfoxide reductase chain B n=1 Tax=Fervidicola ferrireducens TaxID=520764 RepID=A0A140L7W0_9FIRM|nr:4Fe-4S dicluster domain-containing protein [Fervidicola ferrireducens]KXG76635.1 Anaerobic dimethyl sulfoxide reductase chain B [Fervidicola ferrireducens]